MVEFCLSCNYIVNYLTYMWICDMNKEEIMRGTKVILWLEILWELSLSMESKGLNHHNFTRLTNLYK